MSGPELGQRTIDAMNWSENCETAIASRAEPAPPPPRITLPEIDVCGFLFGHYGADGEAYCNVHGNRLNGGLEDAVEVVGDIKEALEAPAREVEETLLEQAVADAPNRCACAATQVLNDERLSFALYAGSARLITSPSIDNLESELRVALSSPYCAMEG